MIKKYWARIWESDDESWNRKLKKLGYIDDESISPKKNIPDQNDSEWYSIGSNITAFITFFCSWIYCIVKYGYLLGVGLGWLPSLIVAGIAGFLWPLIALVIMVIIVGITYESFSP